jgi:glycosyltransferase involved in cell wall biosynthesis
MTEKVLLITNRQPDDPGGRAAKISSRIQLLDEFGWDVVVGYVPEPYVSGFPKRLFSVIRAGKQEDVDIVLSINNPFHLHLHGFFASTVLNVPWIAEFRDPILPRPDLSSDDFRWYPAAIVEWIVAHFADRVVWLDGIQMPDDYFETTYPNVSADRFVQVPPMGYDQEQFAAADEASYDKFTITYAGSFYEDWIEPYAFIEGLGRWCDANDKPIRVQFYGDWSTDYQQAVTAANVSEVVETYDFIPHEEIVPILKGSDALLYIGGDDPENARNIPSKLYDYIGAQTPIIAIIDPSFRVAKIIKEHDLGIVVPPDDIKGVVDAIERLFEETFEYASSTDIHERYSRRTSTGEIVAVMDDILTSQNHNCNF